MLQKSPNRELDDAGKRPVTVNFSPPAARQFLFISP
jgi:hypothetical protein